MCSRVVDSKEGSKQNAAARLQECLAQHRVLSRLPKGLEGLLIQTLRMFFWTTLLPVTVGSREGGYEAGGSEKRLPGTVEGRPK